MHCCQYRPAASPYRQAIFRLDPEIFSNPFSVIVVWLRPRIRGNHAVDVVVLQPGVFDSKAASFDIHLGGGERRHSPNFRFTDADDRNPAAQARHSSPPTTSQLVRSATSKKCLRALDPTLLQ